MILWVIRVIKFFHLRDIEWRQSWECNILRLNGDAWSAPPWLIGARGGLIFLKTYALTVEERETYGDGGGRRKSSLF